MSGGMEDTAKMFGSGAAKAQAIIKEHNETAKVESDFNPRPWNPVPEHYIAGKYDIRKVIGAFDLNFNRGAIAKYVFRAGRKPGNDELMEMFKAREHIELEIARLQTALEKPK